MMSKNFKNLVNAMFSVKGRYPNTIITLSEENNDISLYNRIGTDSYKVDIVEQYENTMMYSIIVYHDDCVIAQYDDYDIRRFADIEHLHIKLVKILRGDI